MQTKVVCEGDGQEILYSCRYFTASSILNNKIILTNLDFSLFTSVLLEDIGFNPIKYRIFYCNSQGREMEILTKWTQRAAIDKIYTKKLNLFYFTVKYKYQGKINYISNFSNIKNILTHLNRYTTPGYYIYIY